MRDVRHAATQPDWPKAVPGETFDPVCGMAVAPGRAAGEVLYDGATYRFCSQHCLKVFEADPQRYAVRIYDEVSPPEEAATAPGWPKAVVYTCPMHPQVRQRDSSCRAISLPLSYSSLKR